MKGVGFGQRSAFQSSKGLALPVPLSRPLSRKTTPSQWGSGSNKDRRRSPTNDRDNSGGAHHDRGRDGLHDGGRGRRDRYASDCSYCRYDRLRKPSGLETIERRLRHN